MLQASNSGKDCLGAVVLKNQTDMEKILLKRIPGSQHPAPTKGWAHEADARAFLQGDEEAFDRLFQALFAPLCAFAYGLLADRPLAEDLVGDAFLKLWERRATLATEGNLRSYLYTSVRNACTDTLRREGRRRLYVTETRATGERADHPVLHRIVKAETLHQVFSALNTLPPKCGQVFRLYYLEEKPLADIAGELHLSLSTVKSQKGRALLLLKQRLGHLLAP